MIWGAARKRARVDAVVAAYTQWRSERDAVRAAYRVWSAAGAFGEPLAFETSQSALDPEARSNDVRQHDEPRWAPSGDRSRASVGAHAGAPGSVVAR